jgi:hypothetical protein
VPYNFKVDIVPLSICLFWTLTKSPVSSNRVWPLLDGNAFNFENGIGNNKALFIFEILAELSVPIYRLFDIWACKLDT